ncbi:hypothetical protein TorRG33x02_339680 [Trema orientale]|uniref:Uncharacterized protein n=1 Tax=Trema orientale TaxID=63057 RepID=A0A2P5AW05_TREOI|nr:hypothetical protein TorRG33x02_339680 [Trema orientale]
MKKDQQFKSRDYLSNPIGSPIKNYHKTSEECNIVHSPMIVQRRGRPPKNRKVSKVTNTEGGIMDDMIDKRVEVTAIEEGVMDDIVRKGKNASSFIPTEVLLQVKDYN